MADFDNTFDESRNLVEVLFQKGRDLKPNELVELQRIERVRRRRAFDVIKPNSFNGNGFLVVENSGDNVNKIKVSAGTGFIAGELIQLENDLIIDNLTTPGAPRVDEVYVEVREIERTSLDFPDIADSAIGETTTRLQLVVSLHVAEGASTPASSGELHNGGVVRQHIATLNRDANNTVTTAEITDARPLIGLGVAIGGTGRSSFDDGTILLGAGGDTDLTDIDPSAGDLIVGRELNAPLEVKTHYLRRSIYSDTTEIQELTFSDLEIGEWYTLNMCIHMHSNGGDNVLVRANHNGAVICSVETENNSGESSEAVVAGAQITFEAAAEEITFEVNGIVSSTSFIGIDQTIILSSQPSANINYVQLVKWTSGETLPVTTNTLTSDVTSNGNIAALEFTGLTIGEYYQVHLQSRFVSVNGDIVHININHDGSTIGRTAHENSLVESEDAVYSTTVAFQATATTVTFEAAGINDASSLIDGEVGSPQNSTFAQLVHLIDTNFSPIVQTNVLGSNVAANGNIPSLAFSGLTIGNWYTLNMQGFIVSHNGDDVQLNASNGDKFLCQLRHENNQGVLNDDAVMGTSITFKAIDTSVTFEVSGISSLSNIQGDGTQSNTFVQLIEYALGQSPQMGLLKPADKPNQVLMSSNAGNAPTWRTPVFNSENIGDGAITVDKIGAASITSSKIASGSEVNQILALGNLGDATTAGYSGAISVGNLITAVAPADGFYLLVLRGFIETTNNPGGGPFSLINTRYVSTLRINSVDQSPALEGRHSSSFPGATINSVTFAAPISITEIATLTSGDSVHFRITSTSGVTSSDSDLELQLIRLY